MCLPLVKLVNLCFESFLLTTYILFLATEHTCLIPWVEKRMITKVVLTAAKVITAITRRGVLSGKIECLRSSDTIKQSSSDNSMSLV